VHFLNGPTTRRNVDEHWREHDRDYALYCAE
jgi:hypothetical protein